MSIDRLFVEFNWNNAGAQAELLWNGKVGRLRVMLDGRLAASEDWMDWCDDMRTTTGLKRLATTALVNARNDLLRIENLKDLCEFLRGPFGSHVDWDDLPTYGGKEPADTKGIWSWDPECVLIGSGSDVKVMTRADYEELAA